MVGFDSSEVERSFNPPLRIRLLKNVIIKVDMNKQVLSYGDKNRSIILIDGSNFFFKLKDLHLQNLLSFDFSGFAKKLAASHKIIQATYYVGAIRTDGTQKSQKLFNEQRKLLSHLKKHNLGYTLGYPLKSDSIFHEKGVDVHMAVDILVAT